MAEPHKQRQTSIHKVVPDRNSIGRYLAALLSGLLLSTPYNSPDLFLLTWVAFVPLLLAITNQSLGVTYRLAVTSGLTAYLVANFWIVDFIVLFKGYGPLLTWTLAVTFWLYSAHMPAFLILCYQWIRRSTGISPFIVFPLVAVVFFNLYPMLFVAQLGASQSHFLTALQAMEWTGVQGLDFLIALVNIAVATTLAQWFKQTGITPSHINLGNGITLLVTLGWMSWGLYSLVAWDRTIDQWPTRAVGFVQPNETPSVDVPPPAPGFSWAYPPEMAFSEQLVDMGADIVLWPETRYKGYYRYAHLRESFKHQVAALETPLVFQGTERVRQKGTLRKYNSATLLNDGGVKAEVYRKTKRVAFGEYLPLFDEWEPGKQWVKNYLGDFFIDFAAGNQPVTFEAGGLRLVPLICYEVIFPGYVARSLQGDPRGKVLFGLSNNGWFGDTRQPHQHLNSSILRTVENRLPMIHVVNNGPSAVVLPNGRVAMKTPYHRSLAAVVDMPYSQDSGGSFFSRYPYWFISIVAGGFGLLILLATGSWIRARQSRRFRHGE